MRKYPVDIKLVEKSSRGVRTTICSKLRKGLISYLSGAVLDSPLVRSDHLLNCTFFP